MNLTEAKTILVEGQCMPGLTLEGVREELCGSASYREAVEKIVGSRRAIEIEIALQNLVRMEDNDRDAGWLSKYDQQAVLDAYVLVGPSEVLAWKRQLWNRYCARYVGW